MAPLAALSETDGLPIRGCGPSGRKATLQLIDVFGRCSQVILAAYNRYVALPRARLDRGASTRPGLVLAAGTVVVAVILAIAAVMTHVSSPW